MFHVYEIKNQHGNRIYIGFTNNLKRRLAEHKRYWKNPNRKNYLYTESRKQNWVLHEFNLISSHEIMSVAKLIEAQHIIKDVIENRNQFLLNQKIDFRLFVKKYLNS